VTPPCFRPLTLALFQTLFDQLILASSGPAACFIPTFFGGAQLTTTNFLVALDPSTLNPT